VAVWAFDGDRVDAGDKAALSIMKTLKVGEIQFSANACLSLLCVLGGGFRLREIRR
jgi:hypothetical protein